MTASKDKPTIAFFGSSLLSAYWNGAATYYRGILESLHALGYRITFYEPDAFDRQKHRDFDSVPYARSVVYANDPQALREAIEDARGADVLVKAGGVGVFDAELEARLPDVARSDALTIFWDVDAPATLQRLADDPDDPLRQQLPRYDYVLTYGGGDPVTSAYEALGARRCVPVYNALNPDTHHPEAPLSRFSADLSFVGNRLPDREQRVHKFFFEPCSQLPGKKFLLAGSGWEQNRPELPNLRYIGHLYTRDHNAFNVSPRCVLNVSRESMARTGFSPATRLFEVAGAGGCLLTDAWEGIEQFLEPDSECLVAEDAAQVVDHLKDLSSERAREIGRAARRRMLQEHTYRHRARQLDTLLCSPTTSLVQS